MELDDYIFVLAMLTALILALFIVGCLALYYDYKERDEEP